MRMPIKEYLYKTDNGEWIYVPNGEEVATVKNEDS